MNQDKIMPQRALLSVSDKTGIVRLAKALRKLDIEILSTGGTAKLLIEEKIAVTPVSDYTEYPEMMDGRVKTLHPRIHGGILSRRGKDEDAMSANGIKAIDIVVVNLYPFEATIAKDDCSYAEAIENIDIGGPTMIRAAAKNHADVAVVVEPEDYEKLVESLDQGGLNAESRTQLARKAFAHTARYEAAIANYLDSDASTDSFPSRLRLDFELQQNLRYGENPHQLAAFYRQKDVSPGCITSAEQIQGKALSYNNIADTDAALECVKQFEDIPACVIVKHANPCGVALASDIKTAYQKAYETDPESAFGGIIAFNQPLDEVTAEKIVEQQFVEVIVAPEVSLEAAKIIASKKNVRLLRSGCWGQQDQQAFHLQKVAGGLLWQQADLALSDELKVVSHVEPDIEQLADLQFAWKVAKFVKSNAIVYAKNRQTVGVGAGQMSRVNSARIAAIKAEHAGLEVKSAVMASDAFFPFRDAIDSAAEAGIKAIIQPGGSMRDEEVIAAADEHGIAMVFTGMRHFRH